ncbi:MAG: hypothetical protein J1E01_04355 [Acetatifactor sp.]|nr:hypothetical protein [Acetatifactor sp.]
MAKYSYGNAIMKIYRANKNLNENVETIKKSGKYKDYVNCILVMSSSKLFGSTLKIPFQISNVNDLINESAFPILLINNNIFSRDYFYKDLRFMQAFFEVNKKYVLDYLHLKNKFEHAFLNGLREEADYILSEIEQKFGLSFWLIESKLLLYNEWDYKKYVSYYLEIRDSCENDLLRNHIRMCKRKVNLRTRSRDYELFYLENIEGYSHSDKLEYMAYGYYVQFMGFETHKVLSDDMKKSLGIMLYHLSFIDSWLLFKRLIICLNTVENNENAKKLLKTYKNLFCPEEYGRGNTYHIIKKEFCKSNYRDCLKKCEYELMKYGNHFEVLDIYIKCLVLTERKKVLLKEDSPLHKLSDVLIKCYIKEDDSDYAFTYIDYCDRYSRALSMFSSYYELLGIVENTMEPRNEKSKWSFYIKLYDRYFFNEEAVCIQHDKDKYIDELKKNWEELYTCEWNYAYRHEPYKNVYEIDDMTKRFNAIEVNEDLCIKWENKISNLNKLIYEESVVNKFQCFIDQERYMEAVHLFVEVYIKSTFLVLKMDIEKLESRLSNAVRLNMLEEIDYFIFLDIRRKKREEKNVFDQAMVDSFESILKKYQITKPSDIAIIDRQPTPNILMFWEGCCNRILNESPCDLYDEEELAEKILLLNNIIKYNPRALYKEWLAKLELDKDYSDIIKLYGKKEWITDKIIADEILLENDENIMSSYDGLCGLSMHQILESENKISLFKEVFAQCKKEYVRQVNEQMGSRVRHSILDTEFVQLLKKFDLFFPLCSVQEKENILAEHPYIKKLPLTEKETVYLRLQECCINLFEKISLAKKELIFFTHKEKDREYTSMYVTIDELKRYIQRIEDISNETRFINSIKEILDNILIDRLYILRERVKNRLLNIQKEYINSLQIIIDDKKMYASVHNLEKEMEELIYKIVAWFNLFSNGERECDFGTYLDEQAQIYSDFEFLYSNNKDTETKIKLKVIRDIDMILKNLIRNVQLHSGYAANLCDAEAKFVFCLDKRGHFSLETSNRVVLEKENDCLVSKVNNVNNLTSNENVVNDFGVIEGKGQGYQSIKSMMKNNYYNAMINVAIVNNIFKAQIQFDLERE